MGDLISRSKVIDVLKETGIIIDNDLGHLVVDEIERIPTSYDVEKVVEEMKKHSYIVRVARMNGTDHRKILNPAKAIEIVRKGGVE